eukprot:365226-Chlamydomonas_euryale.AAC.18
MAPADAPVPDNPVERCSRMAAQRGPLSHTVAESILPSSPCCVASQTRALRRPGFGRICAAAHTPCCAHLALCACPRVPLSICMPARACAHLPPSACLAHLPPSACLCTPPPSACLSRLLHLHACAHLPPCACLRTPPSMCMPAHASLHVHACARLPPSACLRTPPSICMPAHTSQCPERGRHACARHTLLKGQRHAYTCGCPPDMRRLIYPDSWKQGARRVTASRDKGSSGPSLERNETCRGRKQHALARWRRAAGLQQKSGGWQPGDARGVAALKPPRITTCLYMPNSPAPLLQTSNVCVAGELNACLSSDMTQQIER